MAPATRVAHALNLAAIPKLNGGLHRQLVAARYLVVRTQELVQGMNYRLSVERMCGQWRGSGLWTNWAKQIS